MLLFLSNDSPLSPEQVDLYPCIRCTLSFGGQDRDKKLRVAWVDTLPYHL